MQTLKVSDETYEAIKDQLGSDDKVVKLAEEYEDLIGQTFTFWCARHIYHGTVKAVNDSFITLEDAGIVYETGELNEKKASDLQELPNEVYIPLYAIEMFTAMKW